jgi:hypothetical protein
MRFFVLLREGLVPDDALRGQPLDGVMNRDAMTTPACPVGMSHGLGRGPENRGMGDSNYKSALPHRSSSLSLLAFLAATLPGAASASAVFTDTSHITVANTQVESGGDTSDNPSVVNAAVGSLLGYSAAGTFNCCGSAYLGDKLSDGDIGVGVPRDGRYAIPSAGPASLKLSFGTTVTLGSIAIYDGYAHRDDGTYTLKDGAGTVRGAWTISTTTRIGNNDGVDSFWLTFKAPVSTDQLVFDTTSMDVGSTNRCREIQGCAGPVPERSALLPRRQPRWRARVC